MRSRGLLPVPAVEQRATGMARLASERLLDRCHRAQDRRLPSPRPEEPAGLRLGVAVFEPCADRPRRGGTGTIHAATASPAGSRPATWRRTSATSRLTSGDTRSGRVRACRCGRICLALLATDDLAAADHEHAAGARSARAHAVHPDVRQRHELRHASPPDGQEDPVRDAAPVLRVMARPDRRRPPSGDGAAPEHRPGAHPLRAGRLQTRTISDGTATTTWEELRRVVARHLRSPTTSLCAGELPDAWRIRAPLVWRGDDAALAARGARLRRGRRTWVSLVVRPIRDRREGALRSLERAVLGVDARRAWRPVQTGEPRRQTAVPGRRDDAPKAPRGAPQVSRMASLGARARPRWVPVALAALAMLTSTAPASAAAGPTGRAAGADAERRVASAERSRSCHATGWRTITLPDSRRSIAMDVAAVDGRAAWVVGIRAGRGIPRRPWVVRRTAAGWRSLPTPSVGSGAGLVAVDARSARAAWAVGYRPSGRSFRPVAMRWSGARWVGASPRWRGGGTAVLTDVSTGRHTWAVGYRTSASGQQPYAIRRQGSRWVRHDPPLAGGRFGALTAVAASGTRGILAAGWVGDRTAIRPLIVRWDGSGWQREPLPGTFADETVLTGLSVRDDDTWAVGYQVAGASICSGAVPPSRGRLDPCRGSHRLDLDAPR